MTIVFCSLEQAVASAFALTDNLLITMAGSVVYVWDTMCRGGRCVLTLRGHTDVSACKLILFINTPYSQIFILTNIRITREFDVWQTINAGCKVIPPHNHLQNLTRVDSAEVSTVSPTGPFRITTTSDTIASTLCLVVTASNDKTLRVWDMSTGKCVDVLEGHQGVSSSYISYIFYQHCLLS